MPNTADNTCPTLTNDEIDALVAEKVLGIIGMEGWKSDRQVYGDGYHYSTNISDAWQVAEKLIEDGWEPEIQYRGKKRDWEAWFGHATFDAHFANSPTAQMAICLAALKAVGVNV